MINKLKNILMNLQKYLLVKKPFKTIKSNDIFIMTYLKQSKIRIHGTNNIINIHNGDFKRIKVGIDGNNNNLIIKDNAIIRNLEIIIHGDNHNISIDEYINIGGAKIVSCGKPTSITIGKNCLLASNIELRSCDGHNIYQNNKIINNSQDIIISDNVWLGENVKILKGAKIGRDCIVGINSTVTSNSFSNGLILAGTPAKIVKEGVSWIK